LIKKLYKILFVTFISIWSQMITPSYSFGVIPIEYKVKAAFIYKFINFIEWPDHAWERSEDTIVIGVFGENPIFEALNANSQKKIKGRQIKIEHIKNLQDLKNSHIVFIGKAGTLDLKSILDHLKKGNVLTISDTKEFAQMGGMINFYLEKGKTRFEMNPEAANEAELKISSHILRLAKIVRTQNSSEEN
jgi:hypothetical protein